MRVRFKPPILLLLLSGISGTQAAPAPTPAPATAASPGASDLTGVNPGPFNPARAARLEAGVRIFMNLARVPGAAVAVVRDGRTVYLKGFGMRERGRPDPVTPDTLMMIGSTGKGMTTLMMATLIDEGKISWDTPAARLYPDFAVSDPALTSRITLGDMVGNRTGLGRHDTEMFFAEPSPTPAGIIHSIREYPVTGEYGKTFGYVNQMVGAAGYISARAGVDSGDLYTGYVAQMQHRVFDPIGMMRTTFSFERVEADRNHAMPHGLTAAYVYVPLPLGAERRLESIAPAGASWSSARDLARYLITQLNRGIAPDGRRVVSPENLQATWKPGVEISPGAFYGMGWMIADYKGQRLITHGGGTNGFSSDLSFLPDAGLGIAVLSNGQSSNLFTSAVRSLALEIMFDQPRKTMAAFKARMLRTKKRFRDKIADVRPLDRSTAAVDSGFYANESLGEVRLAVQGGKLILRAGGFSTELRPLSEGTYVLWDPPLAGALLEFTRESPGGPSFLLNPDEPDVPERYRFVKTHPRSTTGR